MELTPIKKNKKGVIGFTLFLGLAIVGIVLGLFILGGFFFSETIRTTILIIGLSAGGLFIIIPNLKSDRAKIGVFALIIFIAVGYSFFSGLFQSTFQERYVEIPAFGFVECKQLGTSAFPTFEIEKSGEWITDDMPKNTNEWSIQIRTPDARFLSNTRRLEYYICNSRNFCSNRIIRDVNRRGDTINIGTVSSTRHVWVQFQESTLFGWKEDNEFTATAEATYKPFKLFRDDPIRGSGEISGTVGCELPTASTEWVNRIVDYEGSDDIEIYTGSRTLEVGEGFNYVTTNILSVQEGNTQSGGWCIYDGDEGNIYAIEKIETVGQTYNRVNLDKQIGTDECCNGLSYRNAVCQDGNLIPTEEAECSTRSDCGTLEKFPIQGESKTGRWACIDGSCEISDIQDVECTKDTDCKTNERCNLDIYECELAGEGGTGVEREPEDTCKWYENYVESESCGFSCKIGLAEPTREAGCKTAGWVYLTIFGLIGLGGLSIFLLTGKKRKRK